MKERLGWYRLALVLVVALIVTACGTPSTELNASDAGQTSGRLSLPASATAATMTSILDAGTAGAATTGVGVATSGATATAVTSAANHKHPTTTAPRPTTTSAVPPPPSTTVPPPAMASGVYGTVTAGPTCPVETLTNPCPPNPVSARVVATDASGHIMATTTSDSGGRYSMKLAAGSYVLSVQIGSVFPRCPTVTVAVMRLVLTKADIGCDTGIR